MNSWMIRELLDGNRHFTEPSLTSYLRLKGTSQSFEHEEYGFQVTSPIIITGGGAELSDIEIIPRASVRELNLHDIGQEGTSFRVGAHEFDISHTFVEKMISDLQVNTGNQVWNHPRVLGIIYNGFLFSLDKISYKTHQGQIIRWLITGNQLEKIAPVV